MTAKTLYQIRGISYFRFRHKKKSYQGTLETKDYCQALERLEFKRHELSLKQWGERPLMTFGHAVARFRREHFARLKPSSRARYQSALVHLLSAFENTPLMDLKGAILADFEDQRRRDGVMPSTIGADFNCLSSILTRTMRWGWLEKNEVHTYLRVKTPRERLTVRPRERFLTEDEEHLILHHAGARAADVFCLLIDTGLRKSELMTLHWADVDLRKPSITIRPENSKTGIGRTIPILPRSVAILERLPRAMMQTFVLIDGRGMRYHPATMVFNEALDDAVAAATKATGTRVEPVRIHDLRKTATVRLLERYRQSIFEVSKWLGHASVTTTERSYARMSRDNLLNSLARSDVYQAERAGAATQQ
ncbi:MAG: site-specific integrase [Hyphomicrobium sp.]